MALSAKIARNAQPSNPVKKHKRSVARHQKTNQSTIQNICISSQDPQKKTSTQIGLTASKKNTSTAPMDIIEVEPVDNKTIIAIGRIGADMRSAKDGTVPERPSSINATNPRGPQQEGSRADRQGVHKTPRRPFSRGSLICIIIRHSGKPHHAHRTDWAPRPSLLKKKRADSGEHHVHDTTTARLTTSGAQCQNLTKHPTIQPSEKPAEDTWPDIKNHTTIQNICLSSQDEKKKTSIHTGTKQTKKNTSTAPKHTIMIEPMTTKR